MSQNQQEQSKQSSTERNPTEQSPSQGNANPKSAPDYPPATPREQRTYSMNDGADK